MTDPQVKTRASIADLSDEILLEILKEMDGEIGSAELRQQYSILCLMKLFQRTATECLYYSVTAPNLFPLLRTLVENPNLGSLIRMLDLNPHWDRNSKPAAQDVKMAQRQIRRLGMNTKDQRHWLDSMKLRPV
ncbi:hypothetical protein BDV95DRAFT_141272 [Massariosphaeria phaeospora]|uniref:Uncharacterized protein n=1 Tax=Massariosphaeria phaeospora TaxID=100035 RepID=A0A7C8MJN9_9PLEO|nr:hypothetical protein BDV95DRAFT_141272 [Massariosphaeria phaeospora]